MMENGLLKTILKWFNDTNMYFSKFKKEDKRGQVNVLDGCVFWLHWHQLLINGNIYFHSWKSYFCSFSFHSVFFIPLFIYLKRRPSCSFSTIARSGLPSQLTIPGGFQAQLGHGSWEPDARETSLCLLWWWGLLRAVRLLISHLQTTYTSTFNFGKVWWTFSPLPKSWSF